MAEDGGGHAEIEGHGADCDPCAAPGRVGDGQGALLVGQYVDDGPLDLEPPGLRVVHRRRMSRGREQDIYLVIGQYGIHDAALSVADVPRDSSVFALPGDGQRQTSRVGWAVRLLRER